jgi:hypothetical protein
MAMYRYGYRRFAWDLFFDRDARFKKLISN